MSVTWFDCAVCGRSVCECGDYARCEECGNKFCKGCHPGRNDPENCPVCKLQVVPDADLLAFVLQWLGVSRDDAVREYRERRALK